MLIGGSLTITFGLMKSKLNEAEGEGENEE